MAARKAYAIQHGVKALSQGFTHLRLNLLGIRQSQAQRPKQSKKRLL